MIEYVRQIGFWINPEAQFHCFSLCVVSSLLGLEPRYKPRAKKPPRSLSRSPARELLGGDGADNEPAVVAELSYQLAINFNPSTCASRSAVVRRMSRFPDRN